MLRFKLITYVSTDTSYCVIVLDQKSGLRYYLPASRWTDLNSFYRTAEMEERDALPEMPS